MKQGDLISERYELDRLLGRGGMGHVWRARDVRLDRPVAVKVLATNLSDQPEALVRFFSEAQSIARISHPNVVTVLDFGEYDGLPYLVMEFVPGGDLTDIIGEPIYEARALGLVAAAASAAGAAHKLGIVHRDIKSGNILLTEDEKPKLADFGIAASSAGERLTQTGAAIGSPHYISPEQAKGHSATSRSDVYSLGIVLFELLTGQKPFDGDSVTAIAIAHVEKQPPTPSSLIPGISSDMDEIVATCLSKDEASRFSDGDSLARALHEASEEAGRTVVGVAGARRAATALLEPGTRSRQPHDDALVYPDPGNDEDAPSLWQRLTGRSVVTATLSALALIGVIIAGIILAKAGSEPASAKPANHHLSGHHHKARSVAPSRSPSSSTFSGSGPTSAPSTQPSPSNGGSANSTGGSSGGGGKNGNTSSSGGSAGSGSGGGASGGGSSGNSGGSTPAPPTPAPTSSPDSTPAPDPSSTSQAATSGTSTSDTSPADPPVSTAADPALSN